MSKIKFTYASSTNWNRDNIEASATLTLGKTVSLAISDLAEKDENFKSITPTVLLRCSLNKLDQCPEDVQDAFSVVQREAFEKRFIKAQAEYAKALEQLVGIGLQEWNEIDDAATES